MEKPELNWFGWFMIAVMLTAVAGMAFALPSLWPIWLIGFGFLGGVTRERFLVEYRTWQRWKEYLNELPVFLYEGLVIEGTTAQSSVVRIAPCRSDVDIADLPAYPSELLRSLVRSDELGSGNGSFKEEAFAGDRVLVFQASSGIYYWASHRAILSGVVRVQTTPQLTTVCVIPGLRKARGL